jgi:glycosyltransferase involved in cell wall biosynthesis
VTLPISVVIPYHNGSRFIGEALATVHAQTLAPREIVVVDDGSRPEEASALDRAAGGAVVVRLPRNRGVSVARNVGVAHARSPWIAFLDCDDLWDPRKLERQAAVVASHPGCRAVHAGMKAIYPDGREVVRRKEDVSFQDFLVFPCPVFPSALLMERQALLESGLFDPTKRCCEDLDLFMRFCATGGRFHSVPDPLLIRRVQGDGLSRNVAVFWREADRTYRDFLRVFDDRRGSHATLLEVNVDMGLRALYARDFGLLWRILTRAARPDVSWPRLAARLLGRSRAGRGAAEEK